MERFFHAIRRSLVAIWSFPSGLLSRSDAGPRADHPTVSNRP